MDVVGKLEIQERVRNMDPDEQKATLVALIESLSLTQVEDALLEGLGGLRYGELARWMNEP